jgi:cullin-associated NEDD8-dissociated protein 1
LVPLAGCGSVTQLVFELEIDGETVSSVTANLPKYQKAIADSIEGVEASQVEITVETPHSLRRFLIAGVVLKVTILSTALELADAIEVAVKAPSFVTTLSSELVEEGITLRGTMTIDTTTISKTLVAGAPTPSPHHWKNCTYDSNTWYASQPVGFPMTVTSGMTLPRSSPNQLLFLQQVAMDCALVTVARSYDGRAWEGVMPQPIEPTCTGEGASSACSITVPANLAFRVVLLDATATGLARDSRHAVSRLLRQGTYGPSIAGIEQFLAEYGSTNTSSVTKWVHDQIAMSPTLSREYYRHRVSPGYKGCIVASHTSCSTAAAARQRIVKPCDVGSRWLRNTFNSSDFGKPLGVAEGAAGMLELRVDGLLRTELSAADWPAPEPKASWNYTLCWNRLDGNPDGLSKRVAGPADAIPGDWVGISYGDCADAAVRFRILHPRIYFSEVDPSNTIAFDTGDVQLANITRAPANLFDSSGIGSAVVITELNVAACGADTMWEHYEHYGTVFMRTPDGAFYRYQPRLGILDNTVALPAEVAASEDDATSTCPSATVSYLNKGRCVRSSGCTPPVFSSATVLLDDDNLRMMYNLSKRHVYYVTGLRTEGHPSFSACAPERGRSRWLKLGGACVAPTALDETTRQSLVDTLAASTDTNPFVRDINIPAGECVTEQDGVSVVGSKVEVNGTCWEHVHPDLYSVRDFNYWAYFHPGGSPAIERMAEEGSTMFTFPASHPMSRWELHKPKLPYLGRYGDGVGFDGLPNEVQTLAIARRLGALEDSTHRHHIACGSPGEVRNKPELGHQFEFIEKSWETYNGGKDFPHISRQARSMVVLNAAFHAEDQLRQRMAWALSQIFTIGMAGTQRQHVTEVWLTYFDIFTRHAFGNFRDIVRDVAYR